MALFSIVKAFYSNTAITHIRQAIVDAESKYEVGGLLLGHRILSAYYVPDVTVPDVVIKPSNISFVLDGEAHKQSAIKISQGFRHMPTIIGIWHSHICAGGTFSYQDRQSNQQFAAKLNGALSTIAVLYESQSDVELSTYYVDKVGRERLVPGVSNLRRRSVTGIIMNQFSTRRP